MRTACCQFLSSDIFLEKPSLEVRLLRWQTVFQDFGVWAFLLVEAYENGESDGKFKRVSVRRNSYFYFLYVLSFHHVTVNITRIRSSSLHLLAVSPPILGYL